MRKRKKQSLFSKAYWLWQDVKNCKRNATAAHSAHFVLEDLNHPKGIEALANLTGLPEGVIVAALKNIVS